MKHFLCIAFLSICLFLHASPAQATALTSATTVTGSLPQYGSGDNYTFTGTAGQGILLYAYGLSYASTNMLVTITVYKPDGTLWEAHNDRFSNSLPATGTYTVNVVQVDHNTIWGTYSLAYLRGSDSVSSGSLTSGQTFSGTMTQNGIKSYQFTGTAGQGVLLYANASYGATYANTIIVYKPDGSLWTSGDDRVPVNVTTLLPDTGTYTVAIVGYDKTYSGTYNLAYLRGSDSVSSGSLTSGQTFSGTMAQNGIQSYQFTGTTGQGILLYASASYGATYANAIIVYKPDGSLWTYANDRFSGTLPNTGTYTVAVVGYDRTYSGTYSLAYLRGSSSVSSGSLTSGQSPSGTMAPNGIQSYQFTGTAGQGILLYASASYGATYANTIIVYKPDGSLWASGNDRFPVNVITQPLPDTGTYTVAIVGYVKTYSGSYSLSYLRGSSSVSSGSLASGQTFSGTMAPNGIQSYQFTGTAGQGILLYPSASYGATYANTIIVYKPDGSLWTYANDRFPANVTTQPLPDTGTYTVAIVGYDKTYTGTYSLAYLRGADTVSEGILFSGLTRGNNLLANGIKSYKISATASTSYSVTSTGSYTRVILLYKPDGSLQTYASNTLSGTLPAVTGDYTVAVIGYYKTDTGPYTVTATFTSPNVTATTAAKSKPQGCPVSLNAIKGLGQPPLPSAPRVIRPGMVNASAGNINGGAPFVGNPINFDVGYKMQVATDYDAGGLTFSRIYRSDSTWTDNTVGTFWRHNYARTLTVPGSTASITDGSGATTTYTLSGSNWIPDDPSTTATLATVGSTYVYTLPDGTVEKYNSSKLLTRIEYQGGGAVNLGYNGSSQLTSVTNENGRQITMTYSSGKLATLVTPDGTFSYSYTGSNLTTVTKPDTKTILYHYENGTYTNALTGITDEKGVRFATFAYDGSGRATSTIHAGSVDGYTVTYNTNTSSTTNPLTKGTTFNYKNIQGVRRVAQVDGAASTNCVASNKYYNYDTLGRVLSKTDWQNNTTRYEYDSRSNVTKIIEAEGTAQQRITTITYNNTFNLPDLITEPGLTTDYDYDTYGRLTTMTLTDTATAASRVTAYTYYSNTTDGSGNTILGRLHTIDGPRTDVSDVTTYAYDANFDLTTVTNPLSQVTTVTARDSSGRPTAVSDANSVSTHLAYDTNGRLTSAIRAYGTGLAATTGFTYDFDGNLTQVTLPNSVTVNYSYDNAQRLTGIQDALGNTVTYTLNAAGDATKVEVKNTTPTTTYTHDQTFDELSRLLTSIGLASHTAHYAYDKNSNLTTYTDPKTNATGYAYDALQRLSTSTNALSGVTTLGYTGLDDVNSVTDQRSHATTYTYNAFGDVTGEVSPDRGTRSYVVDKAGNVTQRTDALSVVTNFTYDALNRPLTVAYPADTSLNATLTYDASSGCGTPYRGHLCTVADATGSTAYQYDSLGRVTQAQETRGALTFTTSYTYDLAGNILTVTLPSGRVVTYTRNANGQVSAVSAPVNGSSVSLASSVTYLPFGPLKGLTYGNSLTLSATFDTDYNPTNRTISGSIANWTYTTDANSNITQAGATTYGYDALDRVNAENPGTSASYTYDATSNRLTKVQGGTTTTTVPSTSNKISAVGGTSYTYDSAGNITAIGTNGYVWSAAGLMKEYKISGTSTATYTYNAFNQRTKKVTGGVTTHYVYGAGGLLSGEYTSAGALVREYVYLNGEPLAQVTAGSPETVIYLHTDHLGTPRFATNTGGTQVWAWVNDAFGISTPTGSATINLRTPGQYYDSESGLFYNWNRYYYPAIGRYISSDPIGIDGGLNTFNYASVNPVMYGDFSGLQTVMPVPGVPGLPMPIPPIAIPGSPENQQWVQWMQGITNGSTNATQGTCSQADTGNPEDCDKILEEIQKDISDLSMRHKEMLLDPDDLYHTAYDTPAPGKTGTWVGHQKSFNERWNRLYNNVRKAERMKCPVPSEAYYWLSMSAPVTPAF